MRNEYLKFDSYLSKKTTAFPSKLTLTFIKVGRAGFEPTKALPTDLQSAPFDRFGISPSFDSYEPVEGLEPPTGWLQISCSSQLSYTGI